MKFRIIERNDNNFEYEAWNGYDWQRVGFLLFKTEESVRQSLLQIIKFANAADVKRVVEEIEL